MMLDGWRRTTPAQKQYIRATQSASVRSAAARNAAGRAIIRAKLNEGVAQSRAQVRGKRQIVPGYYLTNTQHIDGLGLSFGKLIKKVVKAPVKLVGAVAKPVFKIAKPIAKPIIKTAAYIPKKTLKLAAPVVKPIAKIYSFTPLPGANYAGMAAKSGLLNKKTLKKVASIGDKKKAAPEAAPEVVETSSAGPSASMMFPAVTTQAPVFIPAGDETTEQNPMVRAVGTVGSNFPGWVIPAAIGATVLLLVKARR